jgi:aminoglycoside 3-N-acetyltransferase
MAASSLKTIARSAKGRWKKVRIACLRRFRGFDHYDLQRFLSELGISPGVTVLVHSSLDQFEGFRGDTMAILSALQGAVGSQGTLLMPTLPFTGSAVEYVSKDPVFDVVRTPSRMGLLTELFRRSPGVVRSVHPTHSVAAWGAKAKEITHKHHLAGTPCGRPSPYHGLLDNAGKILFLGTDISVMTFFHTVEEELEPAMPFSAFTKEIFTLRSRDQAGAEFRTNTRLFEPTYSRRRNLWKLVPILRERKQWKEGRLGTLRAIVVTAEEVLACSADLAKRGIYCYDL